MWGKGGRELAQKCTRYKLFTDSYSLVLSSSVFCCCCFFPLWTLLLVIEVIPFDSVILIYKANLALISHIRWYVFVCSFLFLFSFILQPIREGYPFVTIWLNCGISLVLRQFSYQMPSHSRYHATWDPQVPSYCSLGILQISDFYQSPCVNCEIKMATSQCTSFTANKLVGMASSAQMAGCLAQSALPQMVRERTRQSEWEELPFVALPHAHYN